MRLIAARFVRSRDLLRDLKPMHVHLSAGPAFMFVHAQVVLILQESVWFGCFSIVLHYMKRVNSFILRVSHVIRQERMFACFIFLSESRRSL